MEADEGLLPEEEEYEAARAAGAERSVRAVEEARDLVALAFGSALVLGILIIGFMAGYALTGWEALLVANLVVGVMGIFLFFYLVYRRSKLTMRI
jgi:hypothetical protein